LDDVFAIQDEIANEIGNQLKLSLSKGTRKLSIRQQTQNVEAYEQYLKGRAFFYQRGSNLFKAMECFENALLIDKDYALAYAGLSDTYVMLILHGYLTGQNNWPLAIKAAKSAKQHGPKLAETYNSLGSISLFHEWNWDRAESQFKKAIEINPSFIQAYIWYGFFHQVFVKKQFDAGIKLIKKAIEIDPLSGYARICLGTSHLHAGNQKEAIKEGEKSVHLDSSNNLSLSILGGAFFYAGEYDKANTCFNKMTNIPGILWLHAPMLLYLKIKEKEKAQKIYNEMEQLYNNEGLIPTTFAIASALFGNIPQALQALNKACDVRDPALILFAINHKDGEVLHSIPGYNKVLERMGL
jgi:tetratricopeptide (TPR) repeat protein